MTRLRFALATLLVAALAGRSGDIAALAADSSAEASAQADVSAQAAQTPAPPTGAQPPAPAGEPGPLPPPPPQVPEVVDPAPPPGFPDDPFGGFGRGRSAAFRLGGDYTLNAGDRIRELVVVFGNVSVDGIVDQHVVVIMGSARLGPNARVGDNFVVIGGPARIEQGAIVERDLVIVGGGLEAPADFTTRGEQVIIGPPFLGEWLQGFTEWLTRGLVFGRLIVPDLAWVWGAVALFFLIYLAINVIFERPVHTVAATLAEKPLTAFGAGLLVLLLFGPVAMLLAVSVIGIAVIPFLVAAMFAAWILGKVAVARWIGHSVMPEDAPELRAQAVRSFLIGFAIIVIAYMIPLLGIVTWAVIGVLGLGAASMAFIAAYRRERPAPAPVPVPDTPPPPVPTPYQPPAAASVSDASAFAPEPPAAAVPPPPALGPSGVEGPPPPPPAASLAMPPGAPSTLLAMPRALFRDRFAAFVLDVIIVVIGANILDDVFFFFFRMPNAFPLLMLVYHVGFWSWKQTTPGGIICQLRLVRVDGQPLSFADALVRAIVGFFSIAVFFIGALWMLRDPESQTWHDKVAGTYVVKVPRNWPL